MNHPGFRPVYPTFGELPVSLRVLYLNIMIILGIGYIFALIQIYETHAGLDGQPGLSVRDIQIGYAGDRSNTRLEGALKGPMRGMLPDDERLALIQWVHDGAREEAYQRSIKPLIEQRCLGCHNAGNPHLPVLSSYPDLQKLIQFDTGMSVGTLVRVSHIHLFGLTFIFGFMGLIFAHARLRSEALKVIVICAPFFAIFLDIASWWLTKVSLLFAYVVLTGGALMGVAFAFQWIVSFYQLCFAKRGAANA